MAKKKEVAAAAVEEPQISVPVPAGWKTQRWWADTCDCVIDEAWNPATDENNREIQVYHSASICDHHKHLTGDVHAHYAEVKHGENKHKNDVMKHILENLPDDHIATVTDGATGEAIPVFKHGHPHWSFNDKRELEVTIKNGDPAVRKHIGDSLKSKFAKKPIHIT